MRTVPLANVFLALVFVALAPGIAEMGSFFKRNFLSFFPRMKGGMGVGERQAVPRPR